MAAKVFYVGTSLGLKDHAETISNTLEGISGQFANYAPWFTMPPVDQHNPEALKERAIYDMNGIMNADFCVFIFPGGFGTHVELGMALAQGIPIFAYPAELVGSLTSPPTDYKCVFHHHPNINWCLSSLECFGKIMDRYYGTKYVVR